MHPSDFKKLKRGVTATIFQLAMAQQLEEASRVGHDEGNTAEDDFLPDLVKLRHALNSVRYSVPRKNVRFGLVEGVVSFVDGTHVILDQKPHINGALHYNRKCRYSFNVQIVCNEDKVILHAFTGWPGSCCDSTVFSKTPLAQHPERFFSGDQYLIGDTGYALTPRLITPYKLPAALKAENAFYNEVISSARVINENYIGLYKNRWMSLKGIRTQINRKKDLRHVNNHILACVMLHNIGILLFDEWDDAALDDEDDDDINSGSGGKTAKEKRERIKAVLLRR
ncbi:hypothetical protein PR003_g5173 [Phytophthora rubi]|uniref:DDE Tnp4 domain-containing protein n=1 Tax=Phytophthora rubi TaxID=129364 RepID=A0A6A4G3N3_9STRA|nr:hypothetical protein PR003_g5173 [Phytophthora rubi]